VTQAKLWLLNTRHPKESDRQLLDILRRCDSGEGGQPLGALGRILVEKVRKKGKNTNARPLDALFIKRLIGKKLFNLTGRAAVNIQ